MVKLTRFFRDKRGVAIVDYGFAAALVVAAGDLAMHHGMAVSMALRQVLPGLI